MHFSRREILAGISTIALLAALPMPAFAQAKKVNEAELHKPGALGDHILGNKDAKVTVVEYASFTCGHCASFHQNTFPKLKEKYIDTGKVKLIFRVFPTAPAELSIAAGMIAHCAGEDRYFALTSALFETQRTWMTANAVPVLQKLANQAGISEEKFKSCLSDKALAQEIQQVAVRGFETFGVNATPTIFVNGTRIEGDTSIEELSKVIDPLLK
ncbi:MAG TPA: DsbA family protein [Xanthobacteraceae bacterium]|nr:DsbA family protein [Xanthobacteraceae bacterium]